MSKKGDKQWTPQQTETLAAMYRAGALIADISAATGKRPSAIGVKARRLRLNRPVEQLPDGYKRCTHCREVKPKEGNFSPGHPWCRSCMNAKRKKWGEEHKKHLAAYRYIRIQRNPHRMKELAARSIHKHRALVKDGHDLTYQEWLDILRAHNNTCPMCKMPFTDDDPPKRDCIVPVSKGGLLTKDNVQPLHHLCNTRKGSKNWSLCRGKA